MCATGFAVMLVISDNQLITNKTKASFTGCSLQDRREFSAANCVVPISIIGNKKHEGHYFSAMIKLINASFQSCTILIADTLYRHNFKIDDPVVSEQVLYDKALKAGDQWLLDNQETLKMLSIPHQIKRWSDYLYNARFQDYLQQIWALYEKDSEYAVAVNANAQEYLDRAIQMGRTTSTGSFLCCVTYLLEECAVIPVWAEEGYLFEVYPTGRCKAMLATYEKLVQEQYPDLVHAVGIRFRKKA